MEGVHTNSYALYPLHALVFAGMLNGIVRAITPQGSLHPSHQGDPRHRLDGVLHAQVLVILGHHFDQPVAGLFEQGEILDGGPLIAGGSGQRHPDPIFQQVIDLRVGLSRAMALRSRIRSAMARGRDAPPGRLYGLASLRPGVSTAWRLYAGASLRPGVATGLGSICQSANSADYRECIAGCAAAILHCE